MSGLRLVGSVAWRLVVDNWGVLLLLGVWEAWVAASSAGAAVLPHVWQPVLDIARAPEPYLVAAATTLTAAIPGLAIGLAVGALIAIGSWFSRIADAFFSVGTMIVTSIPVIAFIPVLGRLLGYNGTTILAIVVMVCFFPALVMVLSGLRRLPPGAADLLTVLGASRWTLFRHVAFRAALPGLATALRLTAPAAVLSAMTGEFLMGTGGLGGLMQKALDDFDAPRAIGVGVVAAVFSFAGSSLAGALERALAD